MKKATLLPLICLLVFFSGTMKKSGYEIGDKVTDFKLKNIDDTYVSMADDPSNKGYIVIFTCNTCPWAQGYEQRIIDLHKEYASKGYPVIAIQSNDGSISSGDSFSAMKNRASERNYPFPYLHDESQDIALAFGATKTPDVFLVQKKNEGYYLKYKGTIDDSPRDGSQANAKYVEAAVNSLLAGEKIETTVTKGVGCGIKWSTRSKEKMKS